jgi:hypothetical protein
VVKMTLDMAFSPDRAPPLDFLEASELIEING